MGGPHKDEVASDVTITLSADEALVLYETLNRWCDDDGGGPAPLMRNFRQGECAALRALWTAAAEALAPFPAYKTYVERLHAARARLHARWPHDTLRTWPADAGPHVITGDNMFEAIDAVRQIIAMYAAAAGDYSGIGHLVFDWEFDPLKFVDARPDDPNSRYVDLDLLHAGSGIALVCALHDAWSEFEEVDQPGTAPIKRALEQGRLRHLPDIEAVCAEAFRRNRMKLEDPWFDSAVHPLYRKHVLGYFKTLAAADHDHYAPR